VICWVEIGVTKGRFGGDGGSLGLCAIQSTVLCEAPRAPITMGMTFVDVFQRRVNSSAKS